MDPISIVGISASLVGLVDVITKCVRYLRALQSRYELADMKVQLLIGQLSTLNAALDQIVELTSQLAPLPQHEQLVQSLDGSLSCCSILIVDLESKLKTSLSSQGSLDTLTKIQFLQDEKSMDHYLSMLNNQISALNLLLTALNCRSTLDQGNLLATNGSRQIFQVVKDDTSSLLWLRDPESCPSRASTQSVRTDNLELVDSTFAFDRELFMSKVYLNATQSNMRSALIDGTHRRRSYLSPIIGNDAFSEAGFPTNDGPEGILQTISFGTDNLHLPGLTHELGGPNHWREVGNLLVSTRISKFPALASLSEITLDPHKVLLLGHCDSGKTTLLKILSLVTEGISVEERFSMRDEIRLSAVSILKMVLTSGLPQHKTNMYVFENILEEGGDPAGVAASIRSLYADGGLLDLFERRKEYLPQDSAKHFFDSMERIHEPDYIPTNEDIIWLSASSTGIYQTNLEFGQTTYQIFDVGGHRTERKKWPKVFDAAATILYFVDVGAYNEANFEADGYFTEPVYNHTQMASQILEETCLNPHFGLGNAKIVLFLHKVDKLERKLKHPECLFERWVPDYHGDSQDIEQVKAYFRDKFLKATGKTSDDVVVHFTSILDYENLAALAVDYITRPLRGETIGV